MFRICAAKILHSTISTIFGLLRVSSCLTIWYTLSFYADSPASKSFFCAYSKSNFITFNIYGTIFFIKSIDGQNPKLSVDLRIYKKVLTLKSLSLFSGSKSIVSGSISLVLSKIFVLFFCFYCSSFVEGSEKSCLLILRM